MSIPLPPPQETPLTRLLRERRSIRRYSNKPISLLELSYLLWAAYGRVGDRYTVPSAGATYPSKIYVVAERVEGLGQGIYFYDTDTHSLKTVKHGSYGSQLANACLGQRCVRDAAANIVVAAIPEKTTAWYGERGLRYVYMEAGHIGQNIYLGATELGLGTVAVGAFNDEEVAKILDLGEGEIVLYIFPVGRPREG